MGELTEFIGIIKTYVQYEHEDVHSGKFSPVFQFPFTSDYKQWMLNRMKSLPDHGRRWNELYMEIIENQIKPAGVKIPLEWQKQVISYHTFCVYLIADVNENILYIGKSEYSAITRILDRMMPAYSVKYPNGQKMNNVPEL